MALTPPTWTFDIGAVRRDGFLASPESDVSGGIPQFFRNDGLRRTLRFRRKSGKGKKFEDIDLTGALIELGVGDPDQQPTSGTFTATFGANTTAALAFDISAAALQTALNALASMVTAGGCVVTKNGSVFKITFSVAGNQAAITYTTAALVPPTAAIPATQTDGAASVFEVQTFRLAQRPFAYTSTFTVASGGTIIPTILTAGASAARQVWKIALGGEPYDGAFRAALPIQEKTLIGCVANAGRAQIEEFQTVADVTDSLRGKSFDITDDVGIVRVWYQTAGLGTAPSTPTGGRLVLVSIATNATAATVASTTATAIQASAGAKFTAYVRVGAIVQFANTLLGPRTQFTTGDSGFNFQSIIATGSNGPLDGKSLTLYDANGSVGVWFGVSGTTIPTSAAAKNRALAVVITTASSAAAVATALQGVLAGDSKFSGSTVGGTVVTAIDTDGGPRTAALNGDTGMSVTRSLAGALIELSIPYNFTAQQFQDALGTDFTVAKGNAFEWLVTSASLGGRPNFIATDINLAWPFTATGTVDFATEALEQKFAATTASSITSTAEIKITFPGATPLLVYQAGVVVGRDLLAIANLSTPLFPVVDTRVSLLESYFAPFAQLLADRSHCDPALSVDRLIAGKSATTDRALFTSMTHTGTPAYVRAPAWRDDLDLTCYSVWNSANGVQQGGCAISPRHILIAEHFGGATGSNPIANGTTFRFIAQDNTIVDRTLSSKSRVGVTDLCIGLLDSDLPTTIIPARVLPADFADYLSTLGVPIIYSDQEKKVHVKELGSLGAVVNLAALSSDTFRAAWDEVLVAGDSGSPIFLVFGRTPVLLDLVRTGSSGDAIAPNIAATNTVMTTLGGGYSLTQTDSLILATARELTNRSRIYLPGLTRASQMTGSIAASPILLLDNTLGDGFRASGAGTGKIGGYFANGSLDSTPLVADTYLNGGTFTADIFEARHQTAKVASIAISGAYVRANPVNAQTGAAYTLVLADDGKILTMTNAGANVVTVPTNATVAFPLGAEIHLTQLGAGTTSVAAAGGVTINSRGTLLNCNGAFAETMLRKTGTNTWTFSGDRA